MLKIKWKRKPQHNQLPSYIINPHIPKQTSNICAIISGCYATSCSCIKFRFQRYNPPLKSTTSSQRAYQASTKHQHLLLRDHLHNTNIYLWHYIYTRTPAICTRYTLWYTFSETPRVCASHITRDFRQNACALMCIQYTRPNFSKNQSIIFVRFPLGIHDRS